MTSHVSGYAEGEDHSAGRARAADAMQEVRDAVHDALGPELPARLTAAFEQAERELFAASECRKAKPFAPIVQIGDDSGLYYECTHMPSHRY